MATAKKAVAPAKKPAAAPAAKPQKSTALAVAPPAKLAKKQSQDIQDLLLADQGAGLEGMDAKDLAIPRLSILQSNSPQVKKSDGAFIEGAEEGDFFDNVANAVYAKGDKGFFFIPVARRRANIEWIPKDAGGGFVADHGADDSVFSRCTKNEKGKMMTKEGHEIVATQEYYIIAFSEKDGSDPKQAVISMASSQYPKAKKLNTVLSSLLVDNPKVAGAKINPAIFYSYFRATTVPEQNEKGSWMGWMVPRIGNTLDIDPNGEEIYRQARQFRDAVNIGAVNVAAPSDVSHVDSGSTPEDGDTL